MKKILAYIIIAATVVPALQSCKKGEDDPFLSLRSRKSRVEGEWKVTSAEGSEQQTGSSPYNYSWTFDGTTYTETNSSGTYSVSRTMEYTFEKDGKYSYKETAGGDVTTVEGTWNFLEGVGETKKKETLLMREDSYTNSNVTTTYGGTYFDAGFEIVELRHKKMVLKRKIEYTFSGSSGVAEETYVLEAK